MTRMNAAVVTSFAEPPRYQPFDVPPPRRDGEALVDVLAVGLHPRVRSGASGAHYTSAGTLPMIPGVDAVGRRPDGRLIYFAAADDVIGTMADKALASPRRSVELPEGADATQIAAAMNPASSGTRNREFGPERIVVRDMPGISASDSLARPSSRRSQLILRVSCAAAADSRPGPSGA